MAYSGRRIFCLFLDSFGVWNYFFLQKWYFGHCNLDNSSCILDECLMFQQFLTGKQLSRSPSFPVQRPWVAASNYTVLLCLPVGHLRRSWNNSKHLQNLIAASWMEEDIGGYPMPQYRTKNWQIPKYRVENGRNYTDIAFMIGDAYLTLYPSRVFFFYLKHVYTRNQPQPSRENVRRSRIDGYNDQKRGHWMSYQFHHRVTVRNYGALSVSKLCLS